MEVGTDRRNKFAFTDFRCSPVPIRHCRDKGGSFEILLSTRDAEISTFNLELLWHDIEANYGI